MLQTEGLVGGTLIQLEASVGGRSYLQCTTTQKVTPMFIETSSPAVVPTTELVKEPGRHKSQHQKKKAPMQLDRWCQSKERCVKFHKPRVLGSNSFTKEEAVRDGSHCRAVCDSPTDRQVFYRVLPELRVSGQSTVVEESFKNGLSTQMGNRSRRASPSKVQQSYSEDGLPCMYVLGCQARSR